MSPKLTLTTNLPDRTAHRHATYPGDARDVLGQVVGPNTLGERMTAVSAEHNPVSRRTRVGFDFTQAGDLK